MVSANFKPVNVDVSGRMLVPGGMTVVSGGRPVVGIVNVTATVVLYSGAVGIVCWVVVDAGSVVDPKPSH